jgi:hypothetical protein
MKPDQLVHLLFLIEDYRDAEVAKAEANFSYHDRVQRIQIQNEVDTARRRLNEYLATLKDPT